MGFKIFTEYGASSRNEATLRVSGYLFISNAILKRLNVDTSGEEIQQGAILLFDEDSNLLGIKLSEEYDQKQQDQRKLSKEQSGAAINILPLLRFYGFDKPTEKHLLKVDVRENMYVIDLSEIKLKKI